MVSTLVQFALGVGSFSLFATTSHARTLAARDFITPTDLPGTWSAQGCYIDVGRTLTNGGYDDEIGMTAESCVAYCDAAGYRYAGTEYFHECFCGDTLTTGGVPANANDCSTPCAGNQEEACGGPNRLSLFWNGKSAPQINPGANGWNFLGCYTEATDGRILANYMDFPAGTKMTVDICNTACQQSGYTLSGIEYGDECYCGSQFDNAGAPAIDGLAGCDMLCPGNSSEYCGGPLRLETYQFGSAIPPANPSTASSIVSTPASTSSSSFVVSTSSSVVVSPVLSTASPTSSTSAVVSTSSSIVVPPVAASTSSTSSSSSVVVPPVAASTSSTSSSGSASSSSQAAVPAAPSCSAVSQISLGSASTFGVLSYASITNTGPSVISGDIGTTGTSITGFPPGVYSGTKVIAGAASAALADAKAAYTQIANLDGATVLTGNLAGKVLAPGTYKFATSANLAAGNALTLEGTGASSDRWYFQIGSTLVTGAGSEIDLINGAQACNVFWQVGSSATLGVGSDFEGTILAGVSVTVGTAATVHGGVFGLGGSVTMQICEVDYQYCPADTSSSCTVASTTSNPSTSSSVVPTTSSSATSSSSPSTSSSALLTSSSSSSSSSSVPSTSSSAYSTSSTSSSIPSTSSSSSSVSSSIVPTTSSSSVVSSTSSSSSVAPTGTLGVKPAVGDYTFQGCYTEGEGVRALSAATFIDYVAMTLEECAASCSNFDYFGVEYWGECYCGDAIDITSTLAPNQNDCNFICPGNEFEYCGAGNRIEMYKKGALPSTSGSTSAAATTSSSVSSDLPTSTSSSVIITTSSSSSVVSSAPSSSTDLPSLTTSTTSAAASSTSPSSTALPTSTDASSTSSPTSSCTSGPRPSNLIPNPSFEDATSNDWHFLDGSITTDASNSGSASAVLNGDDGDYSIVYDFVPYNSVWGQTIYLSYWAKFTGAVDNSCSFQAMTGSATLQEVDNLESFDWTEFTTTYTVPDNDQSEGFAIAFMCSDASASLYIDDVYFGPSAPVTICSSPSSSVEPSAATSSSSPSSSSAPSSSVEPPAATSSSAPSSSAEIPAAASSSSSEIPAATSSSSSDIPAAASSSAPASSSDPQTAAASSTSSSDPAATSSAPSSSVDPVAAPSSTSSAFSDPPAATSSSQPASTDPTTSSSTTSAYIAPSTTSSIYTGPPTPSIVPSALNGQCVFVGCYSEGTNSRALKDDTLIDYVGMTVEKCANYCGTKYDLFGVEYSGECYCGNSLQQGSNLRSPTVCNMLCDGNHLEYCGGGDLLNVYSCASTPSSTPVAPTTASSTTSIPATPTPTTTAYTGPPTPSIVQSTNGYKYTGCYTEGNNGRALKEKAYVNYNTMTVEMCASICGPTYPMFGVEWSGECYCGYSLQQGSAQVADAQCNSICDGNSLEYCGGGSRLNVYTQVTGTTTIITSTTSGTPAPTSSSSSGFPNVGAYSYVSCYTEGNNVRALSAKTTAYDGMTLESCANDCSAYSYFGVEYGRECYCGNSFSAGAVPTAQSECYFPCAGNGKETCGAGLRLSVYTTSNPTPTGPVPSNPATVLGYNFYGCQTEGANSRALNSFSTAYDAMTLESCARDCQGFEYFGTEYGRECYCGNTFQPGSVPASAASCENTDFLCAGNDLEFCGARSLLTVYKLP